MKRGNWLLAALLFVGLTGPARATPILDQSFTGPPTVAYSFTQGAQEAQSFTVGIAGNLTEVDVRLQDFSPPATGNLLFDIRDAPLGVPQVSDTPTLASGSVPLASTGNTWLSLTGFSIPVAVGDQLILL
jgi:hypothetical protein